VAPQRDEIFKHGVGYGEGVFFLKFVAEINAFWWAFDAALSPIEMHNYRPTSTYILLGGSGLQSNLVLVHWLTKSEPYDYEYKSLRL